MMPDWSMELSKNRVSLFRAGDSHRCYELASLSKVITALAVVCLSLERGFSLDCPVSRLAPKLRFSMPGVTVRMLLCHTAGLDGRTIRFQTEGRQNIREAGQAIAAAPLRQPPGTRFRYATGGYVILGALIEALSGVPFGAYCVSRVLEPLQMRDTLVSGEPLAGARRGILRPYLPLRWNGCPAFAPAGYLSGTTADLQKLLQAFLNGGSGLPEPLGSAIRICQDTARYAPTGKKDSYYGFGWYWDSRLDRFDHDGCNPGFTAYLSYSPATGVCSAWLAACNDGSFPQTARKQTLALETSNIPCRGWAPPNRLPQAALLTAELSAGAALLLRARRCPARVFTGPAAAFGAIRLLGLGLSFRQIRLWTDDLSLGIIAAGAADIAWLATMRFGQRK